MSDMTAVHIFRKNDFAAFMFALREVLLLLRKTILIKPWLTVQGCAADDFEVAPRGVLITAHGARREHGAR